MTNQTGYKNNAGDLSTRRPGGGQEAARRGRLDAARARVRTKDGKALVVRFVIPSEVATSGPGVGSWSAEHAQGRSASTVNIEAVPGGRLLREVHHAGQLRHHRRSRGSGTPFPISSSKSIYAEPDQGRRSIQQNYARVGSAELDALFDEATAELRPGRRPSTSPTRSTPMIWDEVHSLTLYQRPEIIAAKNPSWPTSARPGSPDHAVRGHRLHEVGAASPGLDLPGPVLRLPTVTPDKERLRC